MKKLLAIILSLVTILSFASCASTYNADELNFYDMEKHRARIVEIDDYNLEENYVLIKYNHIDIWEISNDNIVIYSRDIESTENSYLIGNEEVSLTGTYTIVSKDIMNVYTYDDGEGTLSINSRYTHPTKNNVVVIQGKNNSNTAFWINEEAINWEREVEKVVLEEKKYGGLIPAKTAYKIYLK